MQFYNIVFIIIGYLWIISLSLIAHRLWEAILVQAGQKCYRSRMS